MFEKLQRKWKVNGLGLILILTTFALGGSLCGFVSRRIIGLFEMDKGVAWVFVYILLLTLTWPLCVLLVSIPLGKFKFFRNYISKVFKRMTGNAVHLKPSVNLAIFASGAGSNAQKIIEHFKNDSGVNIALVVCNKPAAGVLQIAIANGIETLIIEKERFINGDGYVQELKKYGIDEIILAGFLWKIPLSLLKEWPGAIINIHPALLPKYGGKGMYGARVHESVIASKEKESGISIHYVDEIYDHGAVIHQSRCEVTETDTAESLAQKIHELEHKHYPVVIEKIIKAKNTLNKNGVHQS